MKTFAIVLITSLSVWGFSLLGNATLTDNEKKATLDMAKAKLDSTEKVNELSKTVLSDFVNNLDTNRIVVYVHDTVEVPVIKSVIKEKKVYEKVYIYATITKTNNILEKNPRAVNIQPFTTIDTVYGK